MCICSAQQLSQVAVYFVLPPAWISGPTSLLTLGKVSFIFGGLCDRYLIVVLFHISLRTRDMEHLFIC